MDYPPVPPPTPLSALSPTERQARLQASRVRQLLVKRLPLLVYERLVDRLRGLARNVPEARALAAHLIKEAAYVRLTQDLERAEALEQQYLDWLADRGREETWYDSRRTEAAQLEQHYRAICAALHAPPAQGRIAPLRPSDSRP